MEVAAVSHLDHAQVVHVAREVQRSVAFLVPGVEAGAQAVEQLHGLAAAVEGGTVQRGPTVVVDRVDGRAPSHKQLNDMPRPKQV